MVDELCVCTQRADAWEWWVEVMEETLVISQETPCAAAVSGKQWKGLEVARPAGGSRTPICPDFVRRFAEAVDEGIAGVSAYL